MVQRVMRASVRLLRHINRGVRSLATSTHRLQQLMEWGSIDPPEWADHYTDFYTSLSQSGSPFFLERGIFSAAVIRPGGRVLDLCCGDGFFSRWFYAERAAEVVAVDHSVGALRYARQLNALPNITYRWCDISTALPTGLFANVIWDATIQYFTPSEAEHILYEVAGQLSPGGLLSGFTIVESGGRLFPHHHQRFTGPQDLDRLLSSVFPSVAIFTTRHRQRVSLFFFAAMTPDALPVIFGGPPATTHSDI